MREIVLGPPGTGKTTRLIGMVEDEISSGTPPDRIGYFSFTKKAAREAIDRACVKFKLDRKDLPYFRTLHSLCFNSMGMSNSDVFDGKKIIEFGDWIGLRLSETQRLDDTSKFGFTEGDRALFMENLARVMQIPLRQLYNQNCDGLPWSLVDRVSRGLVEYKKARNLHDYTDMLQLFVRAGYAPHLDVIFIDEAQDLSMLQWGVVDELAKHARRVVIAGDDDQAIYRWAGAAVEHFVQLEGQVTVLGQSWRVPPQVQKTSNEVISRVRHRRQKAWRPAEKDGLVSRTGDFLELVGEDKDILILARNAFAIRSIANSLRRDGVLYEFRDDPSIARATLSAVRLWESLRQGKDISSDDARIVYSLITSGKGVRRGFKGLPGVPGDQMVNMDWLISNGGLEATGPWYETLDRIPRDDSSYLRSALQRGEQPSSPRIRLATIHGSKGGEADHVILIPDMARRTFEEMRDNPEDEARVWYVASTRAKRRLSLVRPKDKFHYEI